MELSSISEKNPKTNTVKQSSTAKIENKIEQNAVQSSVSGSVQSVNPGQQQMHTMDINIQQARQAADARLKVDKNKEMDMELLRSQQSASNTYTVRSISDSIKTNYQSGQAALGINRNVQEAEMDYQQRMRIHQGDRRYQRQDDFNSKETSGPDKASPYTQTYGPTFGQNVAGNQTDAGASSDGSGAKIPPHNSSVIPASGGVGRPSVESIPSGGIRIPSQNFKQHDLLGANEVNLSSNKRLRFAGFGEGTTKMMTRSGSMAFMMSVQATEAGQSLQQIETMAIVGSMGASIIAGNIRKRLNAPLKAEMISKYGTANVKVALRDINRVLRANNIRPLTGTGSTLANLAGRNLRKLEHSKKMVPPEVLKALRQGKELGMLSTFQPNGKNKLFRKINRLYPHLMRKFSQDEAVQGLKISILLTQQIKRTLHRTISLVRSVGYIGINISRAATLQAIKLSIKSAKKASAKAQAAKAAGNLKKAGKMGKKAAKLSDKAKKHHKRLTNMNKAANTFSRISERIHDPFKTKQKMREMRQKMANKMGNLARRYIPGFKRGEKIAKGVSKVFAKIGNFFKAISKGIWAVIGGLLLLIIGVMVVMLVISSVLGSFDLSGDDRTAYAVEVLEDCYKEDLKTITSLNYDEIEIEYEDIKDVSEYADRKQGQNTKAFSQSSNCAEILSMAYTWCEHDFKNVKKRKLKSYLQGMWYGSHDIIVQEHVSQVLDEEGNVEEVIKSATVIYKTYYFNSLFDCKQRSGSTPIQVEQDNGEDGADGCATSWDQIYVWLRNNNIGFAQACGIMGNLAFETGGAANNSNYRTVSKSAFMNHPPDPTTDTASGYGIFQMLGGRKNNAKSYIKSFSGDIYATNDQLKAIKHEWQVDAYEKSMWQNVKACSDANAAGVAFATYVERCAEAYRAGRGVLAGRIAGWYADYEDDWDTLINDGQRIADYAKTFVGKLHYGGDGSTYRGLSLSTTNGGTDCSGFVGLVYQACLPKAKQANFLSTASGYYTGYYSSYKVSAADALPGDVVVRADLGHTGIYVGNGYYVHLSTHNCGSAAKRGGPCPNDCKLSLVTESMPQGAYYIRIWEKFKD